MNENQKLGTIMKELIRFSLPLILSGVLQQLYNWADAFIVGNVDGELSLSAIGVTSIPISFFITTITGFTLGLSVLIAKNFGAKKQDSIPPVLAVFAVILGGVFLLAAAVGSALSYPFMELLHTPADTSPAAISALFSGACRFWRSIMSIPPPCADWGTAAFRSSPFWSPLSSMCCWISFLLRSCAGAYWARLRRLCCPKRS